VSGRTRFSLAVVALGLVAIAAVAIPNAGSIDLPDFGESSPPAADDSPPPAAVTVPEVAVPEPPEALTPPPVEPEPEAPPLDLPENPDDVTGDQPFALTRMKNFRRALGVLERRRRSVKGVFGSLRVAPGRIDTVVETADRRINLQVLPDMKIGFESESDFPNRPDYRRYGLTARAVDPSAPASMLRRVNRARRGSAARDVDYIVIDRDIIDFRVNVAAYLRSGPRPRTFVSEPGEPLRGF